MQFLLLLRLHNVQFLVWPPPGKQPQVPIWKLTGSWCGCSAPPAEKLDSFQTIKFPLTTESAMKKIEDNNTLVSPFPTAGGRRGGA